MRSFSVTVIVFLIFCSSLSAQEPDSIKCNSLLPKDFQQAYQKEEKAILIDVREYFEFRTSRIKGAVNIPSSGNVESAADTLQKDCALFLYCTTGYRSKRVAKHFYNSGFRSLYSLEGGIVAWKKEGMPVEKKRLRKHNKRLTYSIAVSRS
jgi:rhodanese-related sulfurtransferase